MYITVEELNSAMSFLFTPGQLEKIGWKDITPERKNSLITQAEPYIEKLDYSGSYVTYYQDKQFPRKIRGRIVEKNDLSIQYSIATLVYELIYNEINPRSQLQKDKVTSIDTGGIKETYLVKEKEEDSVSKEYIKFIEKYLF